MSAVPCLRSSLRVRGTLLNYIFDLWRYLFHLFCYACIFLNKANNMGMEVLIIFITGKDAAFPIYLYIFQFQDFHFLCPNDTVFDQQHLVCSNWFDVDCQRSTQV